MKEKFEIENSEIQAKSRLEELKNKEKLTEEEQAELEGLLVWDGHKRGAELWTKRILGRATKEETAELLGLNDSWDNPELADLIRRGALGELSSEEEEKTAGMIRKKFFPEKDKKYKN